MELDEGILNEVECMMADESSTSEILEFIQSETDEDPTLYIMALM